MFSDPFTKAIIAFFHLGHVVFSVIDLKSCLFSVYSMIKASLCSMILPPNPCYQFRIHYHSLIEAYRGCVPSVTFLLVGFSLSSVQRRGGIWMRAVVRRHRERRLPELQWLSSVRHVQQLLHIRRSTVSCKQILGYDCRVCCGVDYVLHVWLNGRLTASLSVFIGRHLKWRWRLNKTVLR